MANTKKIQETELEVEVLYQKLGDRWFAFSIVNDEVFMAPVSDDQVAEAKRESATVFPAAYELDQIDDNGNHNETV